MRDWVGVAGVVGVAAFTPGPNNFVVMRIAAHSGLAAAVPAMAAVVAGSLAMLALANAGAGVALQSMPQWRLALTIGGTAYRSWLGLRLVRGGGSAGPWEPTGAPGLGLTAAWAACWSPRRSRGFADPTATETRTRS